MKKIVIINNTDLEDGDALALVSSVAEMPFKTNPVTIKDYQVFEFVRHGYTEYVMSMHRINYLGVDKFNHVMQ